MQEQSPGRESAHVSFPAKQATSISHLFANMLTHHNGISPIFNNGQLFPGRIFSGLARPIKDFPVVGETRLEAFVPLSILLTYPLVVGMESLRTF